MRCVGLTRRSPPHVEEESKPVPEDADTLGVGAEACDVDAADTSLGVEESKPSAVAVSEATSKGEAA